MTTPEPRHWSITGVRTICGRNAAGVPTTEHEREATCPRCLLPSRVQRARQILAADAAQRDR